MSMTCRCPECGQQYSGSGGGHCRGGRYGGCCRTFTSDTAASAHRVGPYHPRGLRRCLDLPSSEGWRETSRGWTNSPETHWSAEAPETASGPLPS
jgi:hypothetical protein